MQDEVDRESAWPEYEDACLCCCCTGACRADEDDAEAWFRYYERIRGMNSEQFFNLEPK